MEHIATKAWESELGKNTRKAAAATAKKLDESFEPVRQTKIYKEVSEVIDDGESSRYGGLSRKSKGDLNVRETWPLGKDRAVKSNEDAGTAVVATNIESKESFGKKVEDFKEKTVVGRSIQSLKNKLWDESENPLIVVMRKITNKVGGFFAETESSRVYSQFKLMDPTFSNESFTRHLREYIVPEILEAYVKGDVKVLKNGSARRHSMFTPPNRKSSKNRMFTPMAVS
ncbi:TIM44p [Saccharomyces cerevisiae]|nr:TIM44p [Saccharomyces boulardii (nom. inval.)]